MIPSWAKALAIIAVVGAVYGIGRSDGASKVQSQLERERAQWHKSQAEALEFEVKRHNEIVSTLKANHAEANERAAKAESQALAASSAAAAANTVARRVRDASATDLLAARAQIEQAGTAKQCAPAIEAAELRERMLGELDDVTSRIGGFAVEVARFADQAYGASVECAAAYKTVTR